MVRGADQPHLNPAWPCGQGHRKVMEWAGARWFLETHLGKEKFPSEAGERPRAVRAINGGEEAC